MDEFNLILSFNVDSSLINMQLLINKMLDIAYKMISYVFYGVWSYIAIRIFLSA